jgi:hypothetical protein
MSNVLCNRLQSEGEGKVLLSAVAVGTGMVRYCAASFGGGDVYYRTVSFRFRKVW